jgi:hypothetical protein
MLVVVDVIEVVVLLNVVEEVVVMVVVVVVFSVQSGGVPSTSASGLEHSYVAGSPSYK